MTLEPLGEYFEGAFVLMTIKFTRAKNNSGSFTKDRMVCDLAGVIAVDSFQSDATVWAGSTSGSTLKIKLPVHLAGYLMI